jgi:hypothetical protein
MVGSARRREHEQEFSDNGKRIVNNVLVVPFVTLDVVHGVIFYLSKSTTQLEVYV